MCGRISQYRDGDEYASTLRWPWVGADSAEASPGRHRWNVPPTAEVRIIVPADGGVAWRRRTWGHTGWPGGPLLINAKTETAMTKPVWRRMWETGRIVIPIDGWFEWPGPKGAKVAHYICRPDSSPILVAGLEADDGVVIMTADASFLPMGQVHDRRPLALSQSDALDWMDVGQTAAAPGIAARSVPEPMDFVWHPVTPSVGRATFDAPSVIEPLPSHVSGRS